MAAVEEAAAGSALRRAAMERRALGVECVAAGLTSEEEEDVALLPRCREGLA